MEPDNKISTEVSQKNTDPVLYFDNDNNFVLVYKKTEKLASAVYMVTGLFFESEPMKWTLRKKVGELLSFILSYKDVQDGARGEFVYDVKTQVTGLVSLLDISLHGGLISQMNFSILKKEFLNLISLISDTGFSLNVPIVNNLSKTFFDVSPAYLANLKKDSDGEKIYRTPESTNLIQKMSLSNIKDKTFGADKDNLKKATRQSIILGLLRKKKELTIKDIAAVIKDCSEKTIQRELNSFISAGLLKREGVRRWSKYSLA